MTAKAIRPMLAAAVSVDELERLAPMFPFRMQPKLDGIRALIINGRAISRSGKIIPNVAIQKWASDNRDILDGFDGEFLCAEPTDPLCYKTTCSQVMSQGGTPNFIFHVFDIWCFTYMNYAHRRESLQGMFAKNHADAIRDKLKMTLVPETEVSTSKEVEVRFNELLAEGHEGAILRSPKGMYKNGRSTLRQSLLLKLKDFQDSEAVIVGVGELLRNGNDARVSELGYTVRSSIQANLVPADTLGFLVVKNDQWAETFCIGTGFDQAMRDLLWRQRDLLVGRTVKFKYMPSGTHDRPRHPVFLGFRHPQDM